MKKIWTLLVAATLATTTTLLGAPTRPAAASPDRPCRTVTISSFVVLFDDCLPQLVDERVHVGPPDPPCLCPLIWIDLAREDLRVREILQRQEEALGKGLALLADAASGLVNEPQALRREALEILLEVVTPLDGARVTFSATMVLSPQLELLDGDRAPWAVAGGEDLASGLTTLSLAAAGHGGDTAAEDGLAALDHAVAELGSGVIR